MHLCIDVKEEEMKPRSLTRRSRRNGWPWGTAAGRADSCRTPQASAALIDTGQSVTAKQMSGTSAHSENGADDETAAFQRALDAADVCNAYCDEWWAESVVREIGFHSIVHWDSEGCLDPQVRVIETGFVDASRATLGAYVSFELKRLWQEVQLTREAVFFQMAVTAVVLAPFADSLLIRHD